MSKNKYTTVFCIAIVIAMIVTTVAFMSNSWGIEIVHNEPAYAAKLFSSDQVHTLDIVVKESDWDNMLVNALAEEYIQCSVVINGESVKGVGIRTKGNSSLSMVASSDSDRYSFKIEFDHYEKGKSYFGLDKLALNNIVQDNTYMKDYVAYQMMNAMGADAPLSSFIWVTVNGEDWGLYLAAEGIEESFAQRVYGNNFGQIYKPDSMNMGGMQRNNVDERGDRGFPEQNGQMPDFGGGEMPSFGDDEMQPIPGTANVQDGNILEQGGQRPNMGGGFGGLGGGATSLIYSDDNLDSYSAIFDNAAFKPSEEDKKRLIASLKQLNEGEDIEQVVDVEEVIRYFVVHNFVLNSDSYTGSMTHNYYLAENNGKLSMIAWDYNLAFGGMGGFGMGGGMDRIPSGDADAEQTKTNINTDNAAVMVNYPIDSPMLSGSTDDKPMIAWIFNNEEYLAIYHEIFAEYMEYFSSGEFTEMYDNAIELISPYVEKEPTAFCTYEEFQKGSSTLREFCLLRADSIKGQLNGSIAATSEGQTASGNAGFIDASNIDMESMGSNSMEFGRAGGGQFQDRNRNDEENYVTGGDGSFRPPDVQEGFSNGDNINLPDRQGGFPGNYSLEERDIQNADVQNTENNDRRMSPNMNTHSVEVPATSSLSTNEVTLLLVGVVVLAGGIVFAKKKWV